MAERQRKIEIYSAGCPLCEGAIKMVNAIACPSCEVEILDMSQSEVAAKAREHGIRRVPSVVIEGKLLGCCSDRGVDEAVLRSEGVGVSLS